MKRIKATSLVEILMASLILAISFAGFVAGFISVRKYIARSQQRLAGVNVVRNNFVSLAGDVNASTWGSGNLNPGTTALTPVVIDGVTYAGNRVVVASPGNYVQATLNVNYPLN